MLAVISIESQKHRKDNDNIGGALLFFCFSQAFQYSPPDVLQCLASAFLLLAQGPSIPVNPLPHVRHQPVKLGCEGQTLCGF